MPEHARAGWAGRVAVAVVRSDPPQVLMASDPEVLGRLIALKVVATTAPSSLPVASLGMIRAALLDQRWADAVGYWIAATGEIVDAYPDDEVWTEERLDAELTMFEVRLSPIFKGAVDGEVEDDWEDDDDEGIGGLSEE